MTRPVWLIESGVYGPEVEPLAAAVVRAATEIASRRWEGVHSSST